MQISYGPYTSSIRPFRILASILGTKLIDTIDQLSW